jgi:CRP-like cAMP-binding protein
LKTKKEQRTLEDLKKLSPLIKDIPFFKDRRIEGPMLLDVVGCMELKTVAKDEFVFEYGDLGDNFYLILSG